MAAVLRGDAPQDAAREAFSWFAAAVCVVAHGPEHAAFGTTLSSIVPVSVEPPLLGFAVADTGRLAAALSRERALAVTVLARGHEAIAAACADAARGALDERWLLRDARGLPFIVGGIARFAVRPLGSVPLPHRRFVLVQVEDFDAPGGPPLLYHRRRYRGLEPAAG